MFSIHAAQYIRLPTAGARVGMDKIEVKIFVIICNIPTNSFLAYNATVKSVIIKIVRTSSAAAVAVAAV